MLVLKSFISLCLKILKNFKNILNLLENRLEISINFAIQDFYGNSKPLGTSDAIFQTMNQYEELIKTRFLVCNCDNLYSVKAIKTLLGESNYNSMIAYDFDYLEFSNDRLSSFSLLNIENNFLSKIIEKPDLKLIRNHSRKKYVSMNIFSFNGSEIYKHLRDCPINVKRGEKEIATALQNMILENKKSVIAFPLCEHVPDLTYKDDLEKINKFLN